MATVAPPFVVPAATRVPAQYGLFSALTLRQQDTPGRWQSGVSWETVTCEPLLGIGSFDCEDPVHSLVKSAGAGTTSGTFTLAYAGYGTTAAIAYNAAPAAVQSAINAIGLDVTVTAQTNGWLVQVLDADAPPLPTATDTFNTGDVTVSASAPVRGSTLGLPKTLTPPVATLGSATPFTVYGRWRCSPVGYTPESAQEKATEHLQAREEQRVEQALWTGDLGNTPRLASPAATTIAGGPMNLSLAIGALEDFLGATYGATGVLHMTRSAATAALGKGLLETNSSGSRLSTKLGTPVAAGSGYPGTSPAGAAPAAGTSWLYASPALFGYRSDVFTSSDRPGDLLNRAQNTMLALAERTYLLGYDPCGVAAAQATLA